MPDTKENPPVETTKVEGQDTTETLGAEVPKVSTDVKPPPAESERKEDWEQKYKTLQGTHSKVIDELNVLKRVHLDFGGLSQKLDGFEQTLSLVLETVSSSFEGTEELKEKAEKIKVEREKQAKLQADQAQAYGRIKTVFETAGLTSEDPKLNDAREAFNKGDYEKAFNLTVIASVGQKPAKAEEKATEEKKEKTEAPKGKPAANLKVMTGSPASKSHDELSSDDKIKLGLAEVRRKQS
jgi:hypothetical protein